MRWSATNRLNLLVLLACSAPALAQSHVDQARLLPAFPGAEGFGAYTVGGRGGAVYLVTTLADFGEDEPPIEGSLRAAVEAEGPRNVLFRVSGYINLVRPLVIREPYITIAGQTAPGEGVTIRNYGVDVASAQAIIRYLRVRPGDTAGIEQDALNVRAPDVMVDHCSVSWGTDETLSVIGDATNVTVQWCLISESLHESVHLKGPHGYGSLLTATGDISIHHSAYALHFSRNPRPKSLRLDFRNNVIYGYGGEAGYNYDDFTRMNYVGNVVQPLAHSRKQECAFSLGGLNSSFFVRDNLLLNDEGAGGDWDVICFDDVEPDAAALAVRRDAPIPTAHVTTHAPAEARNLILRDGGAVRPARDGVDERLVSLMEHGVGTLIDSQEDVGGWPPLRSVDAPVDADRDGLPDAWETVHGLHSGDASDQAADADEDGYTNLEEFLNDTDPRDPYEWTPPPHFDPPSGTVFTDSVLSVSISSRNEDAAIFYTINGTAPDEGSTAYERPLLLRESTHVRAVAPVAGMSTMPAFAEYEKLAWQKPIQVSKAATAPGLRYAYYTVDDWDEGADPDATEPVESGIMVDLDLTFRGEAGGRGVVVDGLLNVPADGIYAFHLVDEYRSELRIGDRLITRGEPAGSEPGYAALRAGLHRFHLRSLREGVAGDPSLRWQRGDESPAPIPGDLFMHEESMEGQDR